MNLASTDLAALLQDEQATATDILDILCKTHDGNEAEYFALILEKLTSLTGCAYAFYSKFISKYNCMRMLLWHENLQDMGDYRLFGTPCETVAKGEEVCVPSRAQSSYPQDVDLVTLGVDSYIGVPVICPNGIQKGHLAVMHREPLGDCDRILNMLRVIAKRAAAELERVNSRREICDLARQYGGMEVYGEVSHMAGNLLNSLGVSLSSAREIMALNQHACQILKKMVHQISQSPLNDKLSELAELLDHNRGMLKSEIMESQQKLKAVCNLFGDFQKGRESGFLTDLTSSFHLADLVNFLIEEEIKRVSCDIEILREMLYPGFVLTDRALLAHGFSSMLRLVLSQRKHHGSTRVKVRVEEKTSGAMIQISIYCAVPADQFYTDGEGTSLADVLHVQANQVSSLNGKLELVENVGSWPTCLRLSFRRGVDDSFSDSFG